MDDTTRCDDLLRRMTQPARCDDTLRVIDLLAKDDALRTTTLYFNSLLCNIRLKDIRSKNIRRRHSASKGGAQLLS